MKLRITIAFGLILCASLVLADDYRCTQGDLVRRIEIVYAPGMSVPCEVHYFKDTEAPGTHEVLWTAQNEAGYCEARAEELAAKLRSYGWTCAEAGAAPAPPTDVSDADDTEALTPADDQQSG